MWSAVGSITQPLFGFGRLKAAERIARENYFEALFAYEASLLEAVSEVEGALSAILRHREQLSRQEELVQLNREALEKSRALYRSGLSDYLDLLDAERTAYESQLVLTSQRAGHFIDHINLYKALGGGW
jgi:multidrug efflux system outer membrane protein